jgi:hypothetical protein
LEVVVVAYLDSEESEAKVSIETTPPFLGSTPQRLYCATSPDFSMGPENPARLPWE